MKFGFLVDVASALFATMVAVAGVFVAGWWFDWAPETIQMAGLFSLSILFRTSSMPTAVLRLFNRFGLDAVQDVATNAVRVLLVAAAYMAEAGLWTFLLITMGAQILNSVVLTIVGWTVLRRQGYRGVMTSSCKGITQRCPGIWSFIWSLNAGNIARRSTRELDILFVGAVLDPAAASLYHIAKKLGEILVLAGTPIQQAVYPELARLWARAEAARFRRTVTQIDLGSGGLGVAFMMVIAFNAELLITLTMGAQFTAAAGPLVFQTLGVVVFLFGTALRPALFSMGMQVRFLQIVTVVDGLLLCHAADRRALVRHLRRPDRPHRLQPRLAHRDARGLRRGHQAGPCRSGRHRIGRGGAVPIGLSDGRRDATRKCPRLSSGRRCGRDRRSQVDRRGRMGERDALVLQLAKDREVDALLGVHVDVVVGAQRPVDDLVDQGEIAVAREVGAIEAHLPLRFDDGAQHARQLLDLLGGRLVGDRRS